MIKLKKKQKSKKMHGWRMGTHGGGARKKRKGSGHRGGVGLAGTGKRGDQKKTLMTKKYGGKYFGKTGITSMGTKRDIRLRMNLRDIQNNIDTLVIKGIAKKGKDGYELNLSKYKILGEGEVKMKLVIQALEASKSAVEKVKKAGGEIVVKEKKKIETPLVESPRVIEKRARAAAQK